MSKGEITQKSEISRLLSAKPVLPGKIGVFPNAHMGAPEGRQVLNNVIGFSD